MIGRAYVSRWHAKIYQTKEGWRVKDLDSKCGIQVNEKDTDDEALKHGDRIIIKEMSLTFSDEKGSAPRKPTTASAVALTPSDANPGTVFRPAIDFAELGSAAPDVTRLL